MFSQGATIVNFYLNGCRGPPRSELLGTTLGTLDVRRPPLGDFGKSCHQMYLYSLKLVMLRFECLLIYFICVLMCVLVWAQGSRRDVWLSKINFDFLRTSMESSCYGVLLVSSPFWLVSTWWCSGFVLSWSSTSQCLGANRDVIS